MLCWSNDNGQYTLYNTSECSRSLVWLFVFEIIYAPQWRFQGCQVTRAGNTCGTRSKLMGGEKSGPSP